MGLADTTDILETGQANQLHKFINGDGVIDISLDASFIGDIIGDSAAQVGCVVIDRPLPEGFDKGGSDLVSAGGNGGNCAGLLIDIGGQQAAAGYNAIQLGDLFAVGREGITDPVWCCISFWS